MSSLTIFIRVPEPPPAYHQLRWRRKSEAVGGWIDCDLLRKTFEQTYHDLLWVLALVVGGEPTGKDWGVVYQFISVYRLALIEAKTLKPDNTMAEPPEG
ncbi:hypothetical protein [Rhizobium phaseoli]|uniref:hypothetical protein n=1 Tax=Rhizobium phaseoli TaxID=396 RepID=UPI00143829EE|nr:hypothetical protein [Rhizobium phaseoli]MDK4730607.1 hypothetical protein [Rhizobium phaseoli]NKE91853.1 hypothetical protein [Rhizobium phaseoli]